MKTRLLILLDAILIGALPGRIVRADMAPLGPILVVLSLGTIIFLGILVVAVIIVSVLVIRAIKERIAQ